MRHRSKRIIKQCSQAYFHIFEVEKEAFEEFKRQMIGEANHCLLVVFNYGHRSEKERVLAG